MTYVVWEGLERMMIFVDDYFYVEQVVRPLGTSVGHAAI